MTELPQAVERLPWVINRPKCLLSARHILGVFLGVQDPLVRKVNKHCRDSVLPPFVVLIFSFYLFIIRNGELISTRLYVYLVRLKNQWLRLRFLSPIWCFF